MQKKNSIVAWVKAAKRRGKLLFKNNPEKLLKKVKGIIHVGANTGQERELYTQYGLAVVWIEPIPEIFEKLQLNLLGFTGQIALKGLVTDQDDMEYQFHLANNNGASSSILDLNLHQDIWPEVGYEKTINLHSRKLSSLLNDNNINVSNYDMLVIDTQGSELLVLKGAESILNNFTYIQTEVPDFEAYKGCCQLKDLQSFLGERGYKEISRSRFATHPGGGNYYDMIFKSNSVTSDKN
ncbi:MAG TPA: FkbM family methyltransferase [Puia sp.]|jgi:FkbM family methyltransferase|nr:FkbM family methyltransferase [Puia sp.]